MKPPKHLWTLAVLAALTGCAALTTERPAERDARLRLDRGLAALGATQHARAYDDLVWVYTRCHGREAGARALLALAALELDPRNPAGRPDLGAEFLGRAIQDPGTPTYTRPLAESAYLTALTLGANAPEGAAAARDRGTGRDAGAADTAAADAQERRTRGGLEESGPDPAREVVYGCGSVVEVEGWTPPSLPTLPGPSMAAMLSRTEAERDAAAGEADSLRTELTAVQADLAATRAELERIRETLKP